MFPFKSVHVCTAPFEHTNKINSMPTSYYCHLKIRLAPSAISVMQVTVPSSFESHFVNGYGQSKSFVSTSSSSCLNPLSFCQNCLHETCSKQSELSLGLIGPVPSIPLLEHIHRHSTSSACSPQLPDHPPRHSSNALRASRYYPSTFPLHI
jgi:hypothetical protein